MAIGNEKVRRYEPRMIGIEDRPHEAGMYADLHGHYVLHSAYAELAAERDALRTAGLYTANRLAEAESQLAELRGRVSVMLEKWSADSGKHPGTIESIVMTAICAELSALAAADGGGK